MKNKFLKLFLVTGISYGILMGLYWHDFVKGFSAGILFGFLMALAFRIAESFALKMMGKKEIPGGVRQESKFTMSSSKADAIEKIKAVLVKMEAKILKEDAENNVIEAKTKMSGKSFGEIMTVKVAGMDGQIEIFVESRPALRTTMVDYGKNFQNVEKFKTLMGV